jgi:hypothetical protein
VGRFDSGQGSADVINEQRRCTMDPNETLEWSETATADDGRTYTATVQRDWMAGHGVYSDRWRWSVILETEHRPRVAYQYNMGRLDVAIELAREQLKLAAAS